MKKALFGFLVLGLTNLVFAQSSVKEHNIELVPAYNAPYLVAMSDGLTPTVVRDMQVRAANFDPTVLQGFDKKEEVSFEVVHKASNGEIIAFYDKSGKIVSTMENFTDVELPLSIREQLFKENEGWKMVGNKYRSTYQDDQLVRKIYKVKLRDGHRTKKITIDNLENNG